MESVYNDIDSHWCGDSYDCLCWDDYTSKEVKTKGGFISRRAMKLGGRKEEFHGSAEFLVIFNQDYSVVLFFVHLSSLSC